MPDKPACTGTGLFQEGAEIITASLDRYVICGFAVSVTQAAIGTSRNQGLGRFSVTFARCHHQRSEALAVSNIEAGICRNQHRD